MKYVFFILLFIIGFNLFSQELYKEVCLNKRGEDIENCKKAKKKRLYFKTANDTIVICNFDIKSNRKTSQECFLNTEPVGVWWYAWKSEDTIVYDLESLVFEDFDPSIKDTVDTPAFIDGPSKFGKQGGLMSEISRLFRYPSFARERGIQGKIYIKCHIDTNGKLKVISIKNNGIHKILAAEAVNIMSKLSNFIPAKHEGKVVESFLVLPINFKIAG